jgi:multiple sugar transport system permease protein
MIKESRQVLIVRFLVISFFLVVYLFPLYWLLVTAFQPVGGWAGDRKPHLIPNRISLDSFIYIATRPGFVKSYINSTIVVLSTTFISTILATLAGYGFSRFRFKGSQFLTTAILFFQMFPAVLLVIPYFLMMRALGLLSTHLGLILAYTSFTQPFCIWMLIGYFDSIPQELDECAMVDGASRLQAFWRVIVPLAAPGVAATALYAFVGAWHEYLFSLVLAIRPDSALLPQALASMVQEWDTLYEPMMAGAVLTIIPPILIYVFLGKFFVGGLTAGAVKG